MMDARLQEQYPLDQAIRVANLALQCLAAEAKLRPNMDDVVRELEQLNVRNYRHNNHHRSNGRGSSCSRSQNNTTTGSLAYPRPSASPLFSK